MPSEARISDIWKKQKLFVSLFVFGFGLYFFYDGLIGYPRSNERFRKHQEYTQHGQLDEWRKYAASRGWTEKPPHKEFKQSDIYGQYVFGTLCCLVGALLFTYWATQKSRTLRTDEESVYTPSGRRVPFTAITRVEKTKWESKGIAKVRYEVEGRKGEFIVDDYKFETEPTQQILEEIEAHLAARRPVGPE